MKKQAYNPYLPLNEYIPDGEPHVFGDRLYIYGSHDRAQGKAYCEGHYEVWSAPVSDLTDWRSEGISYLRTQDPSNADDTKQLWAPDVCQGPDGRYYLFYCLNFYPEIGVAVSDNPAGPFDFYGHVHYPESVMDGKVLDEGFVFDPAVLRDDDGRIYLYYGFAPACEKEMDIPELSEEQLALIPEDLKTLYYQARSMKFGENGMVVELEEDMLTVKGEPRVLLPGGHHTEGTGFEGHGFFEASSIRKINGRFYFVYSSHKSHELCYATSSYPDREFVYGGTLVSNGDVGLNGRENPVYPMGNNHGGLVQIGEQTYIFYHRQTNGTEFSRQGCAERVQIEADGSIRQVPVTSCGLNGKALVAEGVYPASICCHLTDPSVQSTINYADPEIVNQVMVTEADEENFVKNLKDNAVLGFKYFSFRKNNSHLELEVRGDMNGKVVLSHDEAGKQIMGELSLTLASDVWTRCSADITPEEGDLPLYLHFYGTGTMELKSIAFPGQE